MDLWSVRLDVAEEDLGTLVQLLSEEEREKAQKFRTAEGRRRSLVSRAVLRRILATYCQVPPGELSFSCGPHGKPELIVPSAPFSFNLSHSRDQAVIAVAPFPRVGVDIEWRRPVHDAPKIATRYFSPGEAEAILAVPEQERPDAFFQAWTVREAFLKALGTGFSSANEKFELPVLGEEEPVRKVIGDTEWTFLPFQPVEGAGYLGAVAVEGECRGVRVFRVG